MSDQPESQGLNEDEIKRILNYQIIVKGSYLFSIKVYEASHMAASKRGIKRVEYSDSQNSNEVWVYTDTRDGMIYDIVPEWDCKNPYPLN